MGFGFVKDDDEETGSKIKHSFKDRLVYIDWEKLIVGTKVQSIITGVKGAIIKKTEQWQKITISWENDRESCFGHKYLANVIII